MAENTGNGSKSENLTELLSLQALLRGVTRRIVAEDQSTLEKRVLHRRRAELLDQITKLQRNEPLSRS